MKVFTMRVAMSANGPVTKDVTLNMTFDEVQLCLKGISSIKPSQNEVLESVRIGLIEQFQNIK